MSLVLDGRAVAREILDAARDEIQELAKRDEPLPELAAVMAGDDPSSRSYVRAIRRTCKSVGLPVRLVELDVTVSESEFRSVIGELNDDPQVAGIIVLQPLPSHLPRLLAGETVSPEKDIDGITPFNAGRLAAALPCFAPSTPDGGMEILRHFEIPTAGRVAVVIGRSMVVGTPMALMLLAANATVVVCHSRTEDLAAITRKADIVATATGRPGTLRSDMIKPGATVIDFGVSFIDGRIVGDVDPEVYEVAGAYTPVPGGTGAVTNAVLIRNTLSAARSLRGESRRQITGAGISQ